eukprot:TRINITY_DN4861_c0_g1_i2.p1 TRINITY_DN4861_c0_g1~~TRINITY_DN4861_c0_g1_i2.p1  ORF type:complete len:344 (+),score=102.87 TRINITY_DN4861_c0_g1_i2:266-1297(+)
MKYKAMWFLIMPQPDNKLFLRFVICMDVDSPLPSFVMNFMLRKVCALLLYTLRREADAIQVEGDTNIYRQRVLGDPQFYNWMKTRMDTRLRINPSPSLIERIDAMEIEKKAHVAPAAGSVPSSLSSSSSRVRATKTKTGILDKSLDFLISILAATKVWPILFVLPLFFYPELSYSLSARAFSLSLFQTYTTIALTVVVFLSLRVLNQDKLVMTLRILAAAVALVTFLGFKLVDAVLRLLSSKALFKTAINIPKIQWLLGVMLLGAAGLLFVVLLVRHNRHVPAAWVPPIAAPPPPTVSHYEKRAVSSPGLGSSGASPFSSTGSGVASASMSSVSPTSSLTRRT